MTPLTATYHHRDFAARDLVQAKGDRTISVCIPAHDEAATVGKVVRTLRRDLVVRHPLVDEILVVDDHSTDRTAEVAAEAGARVVSAAEVLPDVAGGRGKGEALWRSLHASVGDIVAWCDADITDFGSRFVLGLVGPLLVQPDVDFVKGFYERPTASGDTGGRVTELMARPLLSTLFPHLAPIVQPLSGEYAGRRALLERLPFVRGYGVDLGLLIDVADVAGPGAIVQADLGTRRHRNRHLDELGPQALTVLQTALHRAGVPAADPAVLVRPGREPLVTSFGEIPPLAALAEA
jgi:glucosyl-3-phosphoglycerate synthase